MVVFAVDLFLGQNDIVVSLLEQPHFVFNLALPHHWHDVDLVHFEVLVHHLWLHVHSLLAIRGHQLLHDWAGQA